MARHGFIIAASILVAMGVATGCGDSTTADGGGGAGGGGTGGETAYGALTPSPGGVRRMTSTQMKYSLEYLLGSAPAVDFEVWDDPQLHGFEAIGAAELALGANDVSTLETAVFSAIDLALTDVSSIARFAPCVMDAPAAACYDEVAEKFGRVAWRRPLDAEETARLVAIGQQGQAFGSGDFDTGLRYELSAILQSPNFVYIAEIGEESGGDRKLSPNELASRMSFFLLHRTPDVELLDAAESGVLNTDDGIRAQAQRMLLLPEARRAMDRFFSELFLIRDITTIDKDDTAFPEWGDALAHSMQEEMLRFLQDIVWTRNADAREIYTSTSTFVDPTLAAFYGVTAPASGWASVDLPAEQGRFGLTGKAGFLARFAHVLTTSPTRRGRFYRERLLCREIPPPPPGVNQTLPEPSEPKTMRERLEGHALAAACSGCHSLMDPIGLAFEHFDAEGKYRVDENGFDIDTTGKSTGIPAFTGPEDLAGYAAENGGPCLVRNFWQQSMGHYADVGEEGAIARLSDEFAAEGYSVQEMIVELCTSDGFKLVGDPK